MKIIKILLTFLVFLPLSFYYFACDDSGIVNNYEDVTSSFSNLKRLKYPSEGIYEAFIGFDEGDHGDERYISIGRFNLSDYGKIVDSAGNPLTFKFKNKPGIMSYASDALVTIEPAVDNDTLPNGPRILAGVKTVTNENLIFNVSMTSSHVLGNIASQFVSDMVRFTYAAPTSFDTTDEYKGIWFCNPSDSSAGITCLSIPDSLDWIYESFIMLASDTTQIWSLGRFSDPNSADLDGAGPYKGSDGNGWQKPGQDYVNNSPLPIPELNNGDYKLLISLVPKTGSFSPHYIRLFSKTLTNMPYHVMGTMQNAANLPFGKITIVK